MAPVTGARPAAAVSAMSFDPSSLRPPRPASLFGRPRDLQRSAALPPAGPDPVPGLGRPRRGRALLLGLRPGGGVQGAGRAPYLARRSPAPHGDDGAAHLGRLPAHHRGVPQRRRRLRRRDKLLGPSAGVVSGSALLVDYVLTITISLAAAGDALFSFLPAAWAGAKLPRRGRARSLALTTLNIRGVRESVLALLPVFLLFLVTHALVIGGGILLHATELPTTIAARADRVPAGRRDGRDRAGCCCSSSGPTRSAAAPTPASRRSRTALADHAGAQGAHRPSAPWSTWRTRSRSPPSGLLLCYLLWRVAPVAGKTMNAVLVERSWPGVPFGSTFVVLTLFSEAALLVVAAQAGFLDGPRVLANMAVDSWVPHRFAGALRPAHHPERHPPDGRRRPRRAALHPRRRRPPRRHVLHQRVPHLLAVHGGDAALLAPAAPPATAGVAAPGRALRRELALCVTILAITVVEKFAAGRLDHGARDGPASSRCASGSGRTTASAAARPTQLYRELGDLPQVDARAQPCGRHARPRRSRRRRCSSPSYGGRRHPHAAQHLPRLSRPLPEGRLRLGRRGGLRRVQGRARGR